jgi:hypothetical protein
MFATLIILKKRRCRLILYKGKFRNNFLVKKNCAFTRINFYYIQTIIAGSKIISFGIQIGLNLNISLFKWAKIIVRTKLENKWKFEKVFSTINTRTKININWLIIIVKNQIWPVQVKINALTIVEVINKWANMGGQETLI